MNIRYLCVVSAVCAASATLLGQTEDALSVETARVTAGPLEKTLTIPGDLAAFQVVDLSARVTGFVESLSVDRGSRVTAGQHLGKLSAPELEAQRAEAEANVQMLRAQRTEAEANTVAAQSTYDRLKAASATPGVVAGHDVEMAQRTVDAARAHVAALESSAVAAEAAVRSVAQMLTYLELTAPFDGVVSERKVHPGALVGPSTGPLLRIEQVSRLRLTVPVPEAYVGTIRTGTRVAFRVSAFPGRTFHGRVARPAHALDVKTRSMLVELDVTNADRTLAPGMFAEVEWPLTRSEPSLFVPRSAVARTSERQFVVRVRDGVAEWVDVQRGESLGERLEVLGDLREGDVIVLRGNDEIRPGTRIVPRPAAR